jgi:hypothetical protein
VSAIGLVALAGAGRADTAGPGAVATAAATTSSATTTSNPASTPSTTVAGVADGWRDAERQQVIDARQALWRQGRGAPAPHERLDVESVVLEEVDGAPVALLHTCTVQQQGDTFDIFGGLVSAGGGYESDLTVEIMGKAGGHWKVATHLVAQSRTWEGEAGCAAD